MASLFIAYLIASKRRGDYLELCCKIRRKYGKIIPAFENIIHQASCIYETSEFLLVIILRWIEKV